MRRPQNIISFLYTLLLLAIVSCNKNEDLQIQPNADRSNSVNYQLIEEVKTTNQSVIRLAIAKLNPEEKNILWTQHLDSYINNPNTSDKLKNHLLKIKPLLTVQFFQEQGTVEQKAFMKEFEKKWFSEPIQRGEFTKDELLHAVTAFGLGIKQIPGNSANANKVAPIGCSCYYSASCDGSMLCMDGGCAQGGQCGIFGSSDCTGKCS